MERNPIGNDARQARRHGRLGGRHRVCLLCGCNRPEALLCVKIQLPPIVLELHHLVGRRNDGKVTVVLCRTCHAIVTELYARNGVSMGTPACVLDRVVAVLRALGTFFPQVGKACVRWAKDVERFAAALDAKHPGWRDMPEAK